MNNEEILGVTLDFINSILYSNNTRSNILQPNFFIEGDTLLRNNISNATMEAITLNLSNVDDYLEYDSDEESEDGDGTVYYNNFLDVPITLDKMEFNNFKKKSVTNRFITVLNQNKCNICLDDYVLKDKYITLKCKHNFHEKCIKKWLCENSIHCPTCRTPQKER
jgi:hypothetical protein